MNKFAAMLGVALIGVSGCVSTGGIGSGPTGSSVPLVTGAAADPFSAFGASVNAYRAPTVNPLVYNQQLQGAAQTHANDMSNLGFFSHTGSDGSNVRDRIIRQGYDPAWYGENIAQGQTSAAQALTSWQNSPDHNAILLSAEPTEFGLATSPGNYWVMVLARPR